MSIYDGPDDDGCSDVDDTPEDNWDDSERADLEDCDGSGDYDDDDGQPDERQENNDFAHDDDFTPGDSDDA